MASDRSLGRAWPVVLTWIGLSTGLIFMNAGIIRRLHTPALLTAWHMGLSTLLVRLLRLAPKSWGLFGSGGPAPACSAIFPKLLPIALFFSLALVLSNRAYLHCSVSFIQMMKASHSIVTYSMNTLLGAEPFSSSKMKLVCVVFLGVATTVNGEVEFDSKGFAYQGLASLSECVRIVLIGLLLNRSGVKLDPLTALSYYAPLCFLLLLPVVLATELPKDPSAWLEQLEALVGYRWLLLNGLVAFALNVTAVVLIKMTSPVIYILCGILKDVLIISGSVAFLGTPLVLQQVVGYSVAVAGIQAFNHVGRHPEAFEDSSLVVGLLRAARPRCRAKPRAEQEEPRSPSVDGCKLRATAPRREASS